MRSKIIAVLAILIVVLLCVFLGRNASWSGLKWQNNLGGCNSIAKIFCKR